jgi:hypothetical protein
VREKYCWLVADKPSEQGDDYRCTNHNAHGKNTDIVTQTIMRYNKNTTNRKFDSARQQIIQQVLYNTCEGLMRHRYKIQCHSKLLHCVNGKFLS